MKKICFFNLKGGCAKTTSVLNIGHLLALQGNKVLLVDCDMQSNLTHSLMEYDLDRAGIYQLLMGEKEIHEVIYQTRENLDIIPSSLLMTTIELKLSGTYGREFLLSRVFSNLQEAYDYVLFDCPPSFGIVTINAIAACDTVCVPIQTEFYAVDGVRLLLDTLDHLKNSLNIRAELKYLFATMHDLRNNLNMVQYDNLREVFGGRFLETSIRKNVALAESPVFKQSIFEYKPNSNGSVDYKRLLEEIDLKGGL